MAPQEPRPRRQQADACINEVGFNRGATSASLEISGPYSTVISRRGIQRGIALARRPCRRHSADDSYGFTVVVRNTCRDGGIASGLWLGVTATCPTVLSARQRFAPLDFAADVPNSCVVGGEGVLWDGRECIAANWQSSELVDGDELSFLITSHASLRVLVNGKLMVAAPKVYIPRDRPLYPLLQLHGATQAVEFVSGFAPKPSNSSPSHRNKAQQDLRGSSRPSPSSCSTASPSPNKSASLERSGHSTCSLPRHGPSSGVSQEFRRLSAPASSSRSPNNRFCVKSNDRTPSPGQAVPKDLPSVISEVGHSTGDSLADRSDGMLHPTKLNDRTTSLSGLSSHRSLQGGRPISSRKGGVPTQPDDHLVSVSSLPASGSSAHVQGHVDSPIAGRKSLSATHGAFPASARSMASSDGAGVPRAHSTDGRTASKECSGHVSVPKAHSADSRSASKERTGHINVPKAHSADSTSASEERSGHVSVPKANSADSRAASKKRSGHVSASARENRSTAAECSSEKESLHAGSRSSSKEREHSQTPSRLGNDLCRRPESQRRAISATHRHACIPSAISSRTGGHIGGHAAGHLAGGGKEKKHRSVQDVVPLQDRCGRPNIPLIVGGDGQCTRPSTERDRTVKSQSRSTSNMMHGLPSAKRVPANEDEALLSRGLAELMFIGQAGGGPPLNSHSKQDECYYTTARRWTDLQKSLTCPHESLHKARAEAVRELVQELADAKKHRDRALAKLKAAEKRMTASASGGQQLEVEVKTLQAQLHQLTVSHQQSKSIMAALTEEVHVSKSAKNRAQHQNWQLQTRLKSEHSRTKVLHQIVVQASATLADGDADDQVDGADSQPFRSDCVRRLAETLHVILTDTQHAQKESVASCAIRRHGAAIRARSASPAIRRYGAGIGARGVSPMTHSINTVLGSPPKRQCSAIADGTPELAQTCMKITQSSAGPSPMPEPGLSEQHYYPEHQKEATLVTDTCGAPFSEENRHETNSARHCCGLATLMLDQPMLPSSIV